MIEQQPTKGQRIFFIFLVVWFVLNALQAAFTQLDPDEAYYWMYSRQLDWGYFDHPPAIAILIKLGYALIPSTLGVRLGVILLQLGSFYGMWLLLGKPTEKSKIWTLIALLTAMPLLEVYGFIATPDSPLLFFTVLFFLFYQRFLASENWTNTLLLGACMAALLYSKYHGILLIFFVFLSNLRLLLKPKFYIASIFGVLLFFPHLYWQYAHDFPSFRYHLAGRDDPYQLKYTTNYLLNQLIIFNPFILPMILATMWRKPLKNLPERAFYFVIFGFWAFFLYATSKGHVEPQWTIILSIPFVVLGWCYAVEHPIFDKWIKRFAIVSMILFLVARVALIEGNLFNITSNFHRAAWIAQLQKETKGLPVVFQNSYRDPSMYEFYTGQPAYTFTDANYRKNQFDIWDWEKVLQNKKVAIVGQPDWNCSDCKTLNLPRKTFKIKIVDSIQIAQKVSFDFEMPEQLRVGEERSLEMSITNPYSHTIRLNIGEMPLKIVALFYNPAEEKMANTIELDLPSLNAFSPKEKLNVITNFTIPNINSGNYIFAVGIQTGDLPPAFNSKLHEVEVVK